VSHCPHLLCCHHWTDPWPGQAGPMRLGSRLVAPSHNWSLLRLSLSTWTPDHAKGGARDRPPSSSSCSCSPATACPSISPCLHPLQLHRASVDSAPPTPPTARLPPRQPTTHRRSHRLPAPSNLLYSHHDESPQQPSNLTRSLDVAATADVNSPPDATAAPLPSCTTACHRAPPLSSLPSDLLRLT
jgi:hypothetical protein